MVFSEEGGGGRSGGGPRPQRVAKKVTIRRAPAVQPQRFVSAPARVSKPRPSPTPQPVHRNPPRQQAPQPPFKTTRSGQLAGNRAPQKQQVGSPGGRGSRPQSPNKGGQGKVQGAGRPGNPPNSKAPKGGQAKAKVPGINDYLASDTGYQSGLSELMRTLQQFQSGNSQSQNDVKSAFQTAMERMGQEREQSLKSLQEDFASRGLLQSGLYAQSNSDYDTEYQNRIADLTKDQEGQLGALSQEASNFQGLNQSQQAALRAAAIQRRADKYNVK